MIEIILNLIKSGNGWLRSLIMLLAGIFIAGMYWANIKASIEYRFSSNEARISSLEQTARAIPEIQQSLARIEGALGVKKH